MDSEIIYRDESDEIKKLKRLDINLWKKKSWKNIFNKELPGLRCFFQGKQGRQHFG